MNRSKLFLLIIFLFSILLLVIDLPVKLHFGKASMPFVGDKVNIPELGFDPANVNLGFGTFSVQKDLSYRLGLDLQGGTQLTYQIDMSEIEEIDRDNAFDSVRNIIERRINLLGVSEPSIQNVRAGDDYRLVVELPGISDSEDAISLIGQTAQLTFWESDTSAIPEDTATSSADLLMQSLTVVTGGNPVETDLTGKDLRRTQVTFDQSSGIPQVQIEFTTEGAKKFADITRENVGKVVAIVLDDQIISAPVVQQEIIGGNAVITGSSDVDEARRLSIALNAGALPAPLDLVAQSTIGPSLGQVSLEKSLFAAILGFISVALFMVYIYRREGILACAALGVYALIVLFIFKLIPVTLTLAGIAGFILSIGMAVDANILIFERMKEELRNGKPRKIAIQNGFRRAWPSIRDSNITSIITTVILFYFGSSIVRGFALTLFIGIVVSMFTAITVSRNLLIVFSSKEKK